MNSQAIRSFLHRRFRILTYLAAICYVVSKIPVDHFFLDLLDHFQSYYFSWFALSLLSAMLYFRDKKLAFSSAFFLAVFLPVTFFPLVNHIAISSGATGEPAVKIVSANVLASNNRYQDIEKMIRDEKPDILAISELSLEHQRSLGVLLRSLYPYQFTRPLDSPAGIGLYSRFPLDNVSFFDPAQDDFGFVSASVRIQGKNYNLFAIHPFPPVFQTGYHNRNSVYLDLPLRLADKSARNIVIGDFNNTIWSPEFQALMQSLDLQVNLLTPATWPAIPFAPQIGIDHILIPQHARFVSIRRGANIGSDHYPLIAEIVL